MVVVIECNRQLHSLEVVNIIRYACDNDPCKVDRRDYLYLVDGWDSSLKIAEQAVVTNNYMVLEWLKYMDFNFNTIGIMVVLEGLRTHHHQNDGGGNKLLSTLNKYGYTPSTRVLQLISNTSCEHGDYDVVTWVYDKYKIKPYETSVKLNKRRNRYVFSA